MTQILQKHIYRKKIAHHLVYKLYNKDNPSLVSHVWIYAKYYLGSSNSNANVFLGKLVKLT